MCAAHFIASATSYSAAVLHLPARANFIEKIRLQSKRIFSGGGGRIRTIEAKRSRFTVCPLWPLGNSPIFTLHSSVEPVDGLGQSRSGSQELTGNAHSRCILIFESVRMKIGGAGRRTRTPDLLITNQWLYQLSYTGERTERNHYTTQF